MKMREFRSVAGLEEVENGLARASRHPLHADLGTEYSEMGVADLAQDTLDADESVADRLGRVELQRDLHVVWNNRDDERAYVGSERYNLIQHREVVDAIRAAVDATTGSIEKGVVRDYGAHVDGVLIFGGEGAVIDVRELVGGDYLPPEGEGQGLDRLGLGMRFHNSFNGRSGYGGTSMAYRHLCDNWMVWGEEAIESKASYHIKGEEDAPGVDPDYFEAVIRSVFEQRDPLEGVVKDAVEEGEMPLSWAPGVLENAGFGRNYQKRITARLLEQEHPREGETNLWNLYNAATYHLDHDRLDDLGPETYDRHQGSAWAIIEGGMDAPGEEVEELEEFAAGVIA